MKNFNHSISRRSFLAAASSATVTLATSSAAMAAGSEVRLAILGAGWRGGQLAGSFSKANGCRIVAVADPDIRLAKELAEKHGATAHQDLRHVMDDENVDAVVVATCNHWHCLASIWAINAGKDVYVEKPLSHSQWEGSKVVEAAKRSGQIVQIGTQQRSDPMQAEAKAFLHQEKALGDVQYVIAARMGQRAPIGIRDTPLTIDKEVDYDLWCGPASKEKIYRDKLHYDWHWDWNTGSGEMGNWGVHILDDVRNVAYQDQVSTPTAVTAAGGRVAWDDAGNTPNLHVAVLETEMFPTYIALSNLAATPGGKGGWKLRAGLPANLPGSGYAVVCDGGTYFGQRGRGRAMDGSGKVIKEFGVKGDNVLRHVQAFIDAVQSRDESKLNAPIENGHYSTGWCNLANVAIRAAGSFDEARLHQATDQAAWERILNEMRDQLMPFDVSPSDLVLSARMEHDPKTERFVGENADAGNPFLKRQYRQGYEIDG
ncbi:Gfo/Idh/MocA family protein [Crateriforma spongiae]|uniref:Gfo/Idh/MocA family protein n=1 Tax=Crateriforma spongiae TaxID=2724528 RepID=UPI001444D098|nr:Gfo/Idh/MocA family oxidoreductase [Crateriforma spongiae]